MFRERSCDLIIGLGGGSSMDSAKAVSLLIGNGRNFQDYTRQGAPPLEIPGLTGAEHRTAGLLRWDCPHHP
jgi:alcohol dehydrogenase class IV